MASNWLITGASRGLGREFVRQLRARGDQVVATVRREQDAEPLRAAGARVELLDVTDDGAVAALAQRLEGESFDVLLNNAGVMGHGRSLDEIDLADVSRCFEVNAVAPLRVTRAFLPHLRHGSQRLVLQMTSRMGSIADNTSGGSYAYRASKTALNMLGRSLSIDLAPEGFRCVLLHPGWVQTDMGGSAAPLTVEASVSGLLRVIDGLGPDDNGAFFDFQGEPIPW
ncbi:SDR family oxidoreductase [Engelhardtia mirabilis]|uniref:C-factor n=1 Tax=Engelhardtia mirabilis TaxID=2528011 RepID=A0A518BNN9_9BACT|nr:C-factor [Planctomycetes bacterium Pla133]QDV02920.1 C-factor [Planctomycetes bacterium Pla86]